MALVVHPYIHNTLVLNVWNARGQNINKITVGCAPLVTSSCRCHYNSTNTSLNNSIIMGVFGFKTFWKKHI